MRSRVAAEPGLWKAHGRRAWLSDCGSPCQPVGYNRQPSSVRPCFSTMDTRSVSAGDERSRPQRTLTGTWGKRDTCVSDRTDRRPSTLLDTVRAFARIGMRMFVKPRILNLSIYIMQERQVRFVFSTWRFSDLIYGSRSWCASE
jgi:hypothetical protein